MTTTVNKRMNYLRNFTPILCRETASVTG